MSRGSLRVYLGAAPGVGKTFAMLAEGRRRAERGADVVAAVVEDRGRADIRAQLRELEGLRPNAVPGGLDVAALLSRRPAVALVDELARHYREVEVLLDAGIDVVTTLNVEQLESLSDAVTAITGARPAETLPDEVVRRAEQIELVDMAPEALRRRLAHGKIYPPERIDAALADYFRVGNLTALRELALLWLADRVDEGLSRYRAEHGIETTWPARERIVVAVTGDPQDEVLIRRAARVAGRTSGAELMAVHVAASGTPAAADRGDRMAVARELVASLGGSFHTVLGDDVGRALLQFTHGVNGTQLILGSGRPQRWHRPLRTDLVGDVLAGAGDVDVHLVRVRRASVGRATRTRRLPSRRVIAAAVAAVLGPFVLVAVVNGLFTRLSLASELLLFLTLTVAVALLGGLWPAVVCAVLSSAALNYFFTPPVHTFTISEPANLFALVIFVAVAVAVASVVDLAARRAEEAAHSQEEAATLSSLARSALRGGEDDSVEAVLERLRSTFRMDAAALLARPDGRSPWRPLAAAGAWSEADAELETADATEIIMPNLILALYGHPPAAGDRRVLQAFASHLGVVLERQQLADRAREAQRLEESYAIRTALLAAVSHDLRTPLAGIKAAVSSLRQEDVEWSPADSRALLATIEESADRLHALVANLLDLSRLQTGTVQPQLRPISLDEVVPLAIGGLESACGVTVAIPESLPLVSSDPGLLERVVANLVENAVRHSAGGSAPVVVSGSASGDRVQLRVVDRGPGVPDALKERIFAPFQRLGDAPPNGSAGVGLGLAVARGFTEATGGQLWAEDTPGGGLTMVVSLAAVAGAT
jgi:two-component system, OmpR family, sensor histidine kinase KdpD